MHRNICGENAFIKARERFDDETEMTEYLIEIHNKTVNKDDVTYNLGDISLNLRPKEVFDLLGRMNGRFIIIKGNHDSNKVMKYLINNNYKLPSGGMKFEVHEVGLRIKRNGIVYYMTHYPLNVGHLRNNLRSLHGHIHESPGTYPNHFNVCIDSPELPTDLAFGQPLLLDTVIELIEAKVKEGIELQEKSIE